MSTAPCASAVDLPLAGGAPDTTVKLHPLLCGEITGPPGWFHRTKGISAPLEAFGVGVPRRRYVRVPIIAFLVEHPGAGAILIDTGFHASALTEPQRNLGRIGALMARDLKMDLEQTVAVQCAARGVDPQSIKLILMTHMHFDHASALADFPGATVILSTQEWSAANARHGWLAGYCAAQFDPRVSYRTIDPLEPHATAWESFEHTLDLLGDGSIRLLFTPGHSAGHLSILLKLTGRDALIAGDAIYTLATLRSGERPFRSPDPSAFERSLHSLQSYDRDHPEALIIPGHDMAAWEELAPSYG